MTSSLFCQGKPYHHMEKDFYGNMHFIGRKRVIICTIISTATYLIFITGTFTPGMVALLLAATGVFGYGQQSLTVAIIIAEAVPQRLRATALGTANFFAVIVGATIMPAVAGWSAGKWGLSSPLIMAATAMILIVLFTLLVPETAPRRARAGNAVQAAKIG